jgi:hypothetical protein
MQEDMVVEVNAAHLAAEAGKEGCLEVALAYGHYGGDPETLKAAIEGGHLPCVKLLWEKYKPLLKGETLVFAAKREQVECVAYLAPLLPEEGLLANETNQWTPLVPLASNHEGLPAQPPPPLHNGGADQVVAHAREDSGVSANAREDSGVSAVLPEASPRPGVACKRGDLAGTSDVARGAKRELSAEASPLPRHVRARQGSPGVSSGAENGKAELVADASPRLRPACTQPGVRGLPDLPANPWTAELPAKIGPPPQIPVGDAPLRLYGQYMSHPGGDMVTETEAERPSNILYSCNFGRPLVAQVCDAMARGGELTALRTLAEGGCVKHMDDITLLEAMKGGSMDCVRYV